jgi:putative pyruvate formate lyase activating enzyme
MDQYRPCGEAYKFPAINRAIRPEEYRQAQKIASSFRLHRFDK